MLVDHGMLLEGADISSNCIEGSAFGTRSDDSQHFVAPQISPLSMHMSSATQRQYLVTKVDWQVQKVFQLLDAMIGDNVAMSLQLADDLGRQRGIQCLRGSETRADDES